MSRYGAIEAGGTKFVCGTGSAPDDLDLIQFPTTSPGETIARAIDFFRGKKLDAIGIASFGPVDLNTGYITSSPKAGWKNVDLAGAVRGALGLPVGFETDVNGAALAEARWGAAQGIDDFVYLTIGTGIGGGAIVNGKLVHGTLHPEMGHIRIPRDPTDPHRGSCPFHGDCLEGLAAGPALQARWGIAAELSPEHPAWRLEAHYLALGIANFACTLSPQRVVLGGGVMQQAQLFPLIRQELPQILNGYFDPPEVVPALLSTRAGVLGGLVLAEQARH